MFQIEGIIDYSLKSNSSTCVEDPLHRTHQANMVDASPKPSKPLGLKLEMRESNSVEIALLDLFLTYLLGHSQISASVAAARIHQMLLRHNNQSSVCAAEDVENRDELKYLYIGGFLEGVLGHVLPPGRSDRYKN